MTATASPLRPQVHESEWDTGWSVAGFARIATPWVASPVDAAHIQRIVANHPGVIDVVVEQESGQAYVRFDPRQTHEAQIRAAIRNPVPSPH